MSKNAHTLYELNQQLKNGVENLFPFPVWIVAEISEISARKHCYMELVERDEVTDIIIAKSRATIWSYSYNIIKPYFETITGYELSAGLKIMVQVEVQFSELYGLSLNVKDINPNYTLGDLQQRKQLILQQLKDEGIFDMNKVLEFPRVPKNIAIISSEKAAGYQDFMQQLHQNNAKFSYHTHLFSALMQGGQAVPSIIKALEQVYENEDIFDVVVIIRGGGAVSDLSCFDEYELAANIAQFPLPVLTGIGHDKDTSVVDEVAYCALKTPTAVATFLMDCFQQCENAIGELTERFSFAIQNRISEENSQITTYLNVLNYGLPAIMKDIQTDLLDTAKDFRFLVAEKLNTAKNHNQRVQDNLVTSLVQYHRRQRKVLQNIEGNISQSMEKYWAKEKRKLQHKSEIINLLSPQKLLERGYSITTCEGRIVKKTTALKKGDTVLTQVADGKFRATVK